MASALSPFPAKLKARYYLAPDGMAGRDVYAVLHEAVAETACVALARVVIGQRERTIALRAIDGGLAAHTLYEQRDIHDARPLFEGATDVKTDPAMVQLAKQLIERQIGRYDPSDLEDRYETRLRAMIDAKLKGEGIREDTIVEPDRSNVIDLMAALKRSLGQSVEPATPGKRPPRTTPPKKAPSERRQRPRTTRKRG
jgi:DNA end-binding protein Ku